MQAPLRITFRFMDPEPSAVEQIACRLGELEQEEDITSCRVVMEAVRRWRQDDRLFHVSVELNLPRRNLVVGDDPAELWTHADAEAAIREAFDTLRRRLQAGSRAPRRSEARVRLLS